MNKVLCLVLCLSVSGCAWVKANESALSAAALQTVNCVVSGAEAGQTVETVGATCGNLALTDTVNILDAAKVVPVPSPGLTLARTVVKAAQRPKD